MNNKAETKKKVKEFAVVIKQLRDDLSLAIQEERYEYAARIRDDANNRQKEFISFLSELGRLSSTEG